MQKTYSCSKCDLTFSTPSAQAYHSRFCGTTFPCPICHRSYRYKKHLYQHYRRSKHVPLVGRLEPAAVVSVGSPAPVEPLNLTSSAPMLSHPVVHVLPTVPPQLLTVVLPSVDLNNASTMMAVQLLSTMLQNQVVFKPPATLTTTTDACVPDLSSVLIKGVENNDPQDAAINLSTRGGEVLANVVEASSVRFHCPIAVFLPSHNCCALAIESITAWVGVLLVYWCEQFKRTVSLNNL